MAQTFFTADTHFGHRGILGMCKRPFDDIDAHDRALIDSWNAVVGLDDTVYHLGDFAYRAGPQRTREIFEQLNGTKHLIRGNHDHKGETSRLPWSSINDLTEVTIEDQVYVLCHYGLRTWRNMRRGAIHLYGHSHKRLPGTSQCIDVGVDNMSYAPVGVETIRARLADLPQLVFLDGTDEEPSMSLPTVSV